MATECIDRRPVEDIVNGIKQEMSLRLLGGRDVKDNTSLDILAAIVGGVAFETSGDIAALRDQLFIDTMCCDSLDRYAATFKIYRTPAVKARGCVQMTGNAGAVIDPDQEFSSGTADYEIDPEVSGNPSVIGADGTATVWIRAKTPGAVANIVIYEGDDPVELDTSIASPGLDQTATVLSCGVVGGADEEACDHFRERLKERRATAISAGNRAWYQATIREFPCVERVCFSGCKCNDCECGPVVTAYPIFAKDVYPPYGIPPAAVADDIRQYVFGENNGAGDGKAPWGAIGQILCADVELLTVNIYTVENVNPSRFANVEAAVQEFFETIACVGETFCISSLSQAVMAAEPSLCVRGIQVCGDNVTQVGGDLVKIGCGRLPVVSLVSTIAGTPPDTICG